MSNDKPVTIPALGRQGFSLGCLYDLRTHQNYVRKLWNEAELTDDKLSIQEHPKSIFSLEISNTQDQRCKALDVDANMKLDISGGAVVVEGSAKYVNTSNSNSQVSSVTYTSKKLTKTKSLNMDHLAPGAVTYKDMLNAEENATHVVSSITYGMNAHFKFEAKVTDGEDKDKIAGRLKVAIKAIKAEGEGSLNRTSEEKQLAQETSCDFYGDYSGIVPPLNLDQAKETILKIAEDQTNSLGVPITVTLTPLSSLTNAAMKLVSQLSAGAVNEAARLLQDIEDIQVMLKTLESSHTSAEYYKYRTTVVKVANRYRNAGSVLKSKLCELLPKIKGNGAEEAELMKLIREYDESSFSKAKTLEWLEQLKDEVVYVDGIIKLAKTRGVPMATTKSKFDGEKLKASQGLFYLEAKFVSCLDVTGNEENGEVSLRSGGSVLDDEDFKARFSGQWGNFTTAISADGGLKNDDAKFNTLFFLEFLAEENQCDTKFLEGGYITLREINTNVKVASVKYDPLKNAVSGEIRPIYGRESGQIAAERGFIDLQLRYMEADQSAGEGKWEKKDFKDHPAEKTSFQLGLGEHHGLREGSLYSAELRFQIRAGLASKWTPFKFKARARPKIKRPSSPFIMQVGVANQIDCTVEKGYPEPSITWTRKEDNEKVLSNGRSLMLPNATADIQGVYCVEARNLVGSDTQEILVKIPDVEKNEEEGKIWDLVKKLSIRGSHSAYKGASIIFQRGRDRKDREELPDDSNPKITYDKLLLKDGVGKMDIGDGTWTCEQTGTYQISWTYVNWDYFGNMSAVYLFRNDKAVEESIVVQMHEGEGHTSLGSTEGRSMMQRLNVGDRLWLQKGLKEMPRGPPEDGKDPMLPFGGGTVAWVCFNVQLLAAD